MSCSIVSREELDKIMPVKPPSVKRKIKPIVHIMGRVIFARVPYNVANQLKILIPVGTAIIIVAEVKYARVSTSRPTVNIWWAHTMKPRNPIPIMAKIMPKVPKAAGFPE